MALRKLAASGTCPPARPGRGGTRPAAARTRAARGEPPSRSPQFSAMAIPARTFSSLRSYLGRVPGLGGGAASLVGAQGAAGPTFRGFQSSGVRHDAIVISGTEMAKQIQKEIQQAVEAWISLGNRRPHLSIILVGDNPASHTYVRKKLRAASAVGICSEVILKPKDVSQEELLDITDHLNLDPRVSGILVQLPLPDHVDERTVCNGIAPEKDVDGFHIINIGRLCLDQHSLIPATASAVWEIIKRTGIETFGKNVVVAGRSKNVGMPIAMLLHTDGEHERPGGDATVTIAHRYTPKEQMKIHTQLADIVIVAAGIPKLITSDMIKEGAAVIDVGINYVHDPVTEKTKLVGDVDFEDVKKKAGFITPVPGGVGPMTVAMLLKNTLLAAQRAVY
ncbi:probable bifunctional methylenetetrahydrofolate dehydrogenase/cyclohydrolase 2 isoform X1 [Phyllostomus hastatus]|uniref:probable bifunctional methylenetetrahydrofolate dehydrogenase/cyclohydrolase 2 isoform X1 n=1 Tax=Phyllostomus hastatus TaxID=9423 RepID=UPI001E684F84|nr:probable bifunctional methylenetetrahydrofolate dehydrogenase/cyclohydrolase 2 isoform X1 [Phyllostomus hastatus]